MTRIRHQRKISPIILIKAEGNNQTETKYFSNFSSRKVRIKFATGNSTNPNGMLNDLINYMRKEDISSKYGDKIYLLIDTDLNSKRINEIRNIKNKCLEYGIELIVSSPTFEIWFILHFTNSNILFTSSMDVKKALRKYIKDYKENMNIYDKIVLETDKAIKNAKYNENNRLDEDVLDINPYTNIYKIIEVIKLLNK